MVNSRIVTLVFMKHFTQTRDMSLQFGYLCRYVTASRTVPHARVVAFVADAGIVKPSHTEHTPGHICSLTTVHFAANYGTGGRGLGSFFTPFTPFGAGRLRRGSV